MGRKKKQVATKEECIVEFQRIGEMYQEDFPDMNNIPSRDYFRKNAKVKDVDWKTYWETYQEFKQEVLNILGIEEDEFFFEKKVLSLSEQVKDLKKERKKLLKQSINYEDFLDAYKESLQLIPDLPSHEKPLSYSSNKDLILQISDAHLGETVLPEEVNHANEYNKYICFERMDTIFENVVRYAKKIKVDNLYIILNGDLLCGFIHRELERTSDLSEVDAIKWMHDYLVKKFCSLTKYFNAIDVTIMVGNHGRILQGKPYWKGKVKMNFEYILGMMLQENFKLRTELGKNKKITINLPEAVWTIKRIKNLDFLITHGDILTGAGSGGFARIPFYSIAMSSALLYGVLAQIGISSTVKFDYILMAHLHTTTKIPLFNGGYCFVNGCIIGTNEFSMYKMKSIAKKEQLMLIIDDDGIDGEINIRF